MLIFMHTNNIRLFAMKKIILLLPAFALFLGAAAQPIVDMLRTENSLNPPAMDVRQPRFSWSCFQLDVQIPPNTQEFVFVPAASAAEIQEGGVVANKAKDIEIAGSKDGYVVLRVGSRNYSFRAPMPVSAATSLKQAF